MQPESKRGALQSYQTTTYTGAVPAERPSDSGTPAERPSDSGTPAERLSGSGTPAERTSDSGTPAERPSGSGTPAERTSDSGTLAERSLTSRCYKLTSNGAAVTMGNEKRPAQRAPASPARRVQRALRHARPHTGLRTGELTPLHRRTPG